MRSYGLALIASAFVVGACGGGEPKSADSAAATPAPAPSETQAAAPAAGSVAPVAITGTTHEIKMVGDAQGYRYEPANITVKPGDGIKFIMESGGPHNIAFDPATLPAGSKDQLFANMPNSIDGSSPMMMNPNETWTLSLGNIQPGTYPYHCTPHLAMAMKGVITVQ
ncbi:MAG: Plastocyanin [Gemmatimonadaceae bacterium]|nr:Plastocyanin [Gemmatimonadaceae bacterium]